MSLYKGTQAIAGIPTGLIDTVNSKADANNVYTKSEAVAKTDLAQVYPIINTYQQGTEGYIIYSNGYCEQWGINTNNSTSERAQALIKTFANTNYIVLVCYNGDGTLSNGAIDAYNKATNGFKLKSYSSDSLAWRACGYLAGGEY